MKNERRQHPRTATRIELTLKLAFVHDLSHERQAFAGMMTEYGGGGARLSTSAEGQGPALQERLARESALAVCEVVVTGSPITLRLCGEVRWARLGGQRRELELGIQLIGAGHADTDILDRLTTGRPVVERPRKRWGWISALAFAAGAAWLWVDRNTKIDETARVRGELGSAEERRESLAKRLRASEERVHALETRAQETKMAVEQPAVVPSAPTPHVPRVNHQPPPPPTSEDEPPVDDARNSP